MSESLPCLFLLLIMLAIGAGQGVQIIFVLNGSTQQIKCLTVPSSLKFFSFGLFYSIFFNLFNLFEEGLACGSLFNLKLFDRVPWRAPGRTNLLSSVRKRRREEVETRTTKIGDRLQHSTLAICPFVELVAVLCLKKKKVPGFLHALTSSISNLACFCLSASSTPALLYNR